MDKEITNNLKRLGTFKDFSDDSIKNVFQTANKGIIELTLLFNKRDIDVVCVPTHHFCNLGCKMCHLTNKGLNKDMIPVQASDMVEAIIKSVCYSVNDHSENDEMLSVHLFKRRTKKEICFFLLWE